MLPVRLFLLKWLRQDELLSTDNTVVAGSNPAAGHNANRLDWH